ncbi:uncharacterized protein LOC103512478, partial [Diaphorina citri]|uniref:Uncharacterized protein LOC103512478 n=1 Tax=Diaphorina citri TaxID=121845 RepID=A0A3Q0IZW4_DIACI
NTTKQICPYAIHVFDLKTDRRIRKYQFRPEDILPGTFIANIAVDVGKNCEDTFLYASDELAYGLLSYSWEEKQELAYYMPHHAVVRPDRATTKVRIVFDLSCKTQSGLSLNEMLYAGPTLYKNLFQLLISFCMFPITCTADIRKMFLQVYVDKEDQKFQRFLWRESPQEPLQCYQMERVVFGMRPSPFLAQRVLRQLAKDYEDEFPSGSHEVSQSFYMDDFLSSFMSETEAVSTITELVSICDKGGFHLTKFASNNLDILKSIPEEQRMLSEVEWGSDSYLKVLGIQWNPKEDTFSFCVNLSDTKCSKRSILSTVARIFDILGFISPVTLSLKLLIKDLWNLKIDWDEDPPIDIQERWSLIMSEFPALNNLKIPRHLGICKNAKVKLIGFCDASLKALGACVYVHVTQPDESNHHIVNLKLGDRYKLIQKLLSSFWKRWSNEYLSSLQERLKWQKNTSVKLEVEMLVIVKSENTPVLSWPLGRIVQLFLGADDVVRVALVRTSNGTYKRPVVKLCPLPSEFNIGGLTFHWFPEGIFGIALTPPEADGFKNLLFHPIASHSEFAVSTRVLRNKTLAESADSYNAYVKIGDRGRDGHLTAPSLLSALKYGTKISRVTKSSENTREFNIGGLTFHWFPEGIFGIALTPPEADGFKNLLFHPIASHSEFAVSTRVLRNKTLAESADSYNAYVKIGDRGRDGHLTSHVMDHNGILYFNLIDRNAVGCWNSQYPYKPENIGHIDIDNEALIFPSDVKVVGDDLWVISDRMPIHLESELNFNDVNFRIFTVPLQEAVRGTVCESPLVPAGYQKPALYGPLTYVDNNLYPIQPYVPNYIPQNKPKNFFTKKIFARPELPSYVTEPDIPIPQNNQLAFPQNNQLAVPQNNQQGAKFVPSYNPQPQVNTWSYNKFYNL